MIDNNHEVACTRNEKVLVNADRRLLKEAFRVFADNSVKYTPEGGKIRLECYPDKNICDLADWLIFAWNKIMLSSI
ncbi:MAG TPA: ATP-binding protein [Clostridia bacterium]|nr:ATP-binding protein [Clostridia bacterium]